MKLFRRRPASSIPMIVGGDSGSRNNILDSHTKDDGGNPINETPRTVDTCTFFSNSPSSPSEITPEGFWQTHARGTESSSSGDGLNSNLLAEQFFYHIWKKEGKDVAIELLTVHSNHSLNELTETLFHRGCELWAQDEYPQALMELERSKTIRGILNPLSLLLVYDSTQNGGNDSYQDTCPLEGVVQLYFAMGTVQVAMKNFDTALCEFRRAYQCSSISLGPNHHLTESSKYMLRSTLLIKGYTSPKIHKYLESMNHNVQKEKDADRLNIRGKKLEALHDYLRLRFMYDNDLYIQGRIRIKIAVLLKEICHYDKAVEVWSSILELLDGDEHFFLTRYVISKIINIRKQQKKKKQKKKKKASKQQQEQPVAAVENPVNTE